MEIPSFRLGVDWTGPEEPAGHGPAWRGVPDALVARAGPIDDPGRRPAPGLPRQAPTAAEAARPAERPEGDQPPAGTVRETSPRAAGRAAGHWRGRGGTTAMKRAPTAALGRRLCMGVRARKG